MTGILKQAIKQSGVSVPFTEVVVGVKGDILSRQEI
jgi:hypothetical protein